METAVTAVSEYCTRIGKCDIIEGRASKMRAPIEEYKNCPHCGKKLGMQDVMKRLQKKTVVCPKCKKLIMLDVRVY